MEIPFFTRRHFTRDLILVFVLLAASVICVAAFFSLRARNDISQRYIDNATDSAVRQFTNLADTMNSTLLLTADWIGSGKAGLDVPGRLNDLLFPIVKREPWLSGISVAAANGQSYYLTASADGWQTRIAMDEPGGRQAVIRSWDADRNLLEENKRPSEYDARSRPWFSPALGGEKVFWTAPYRFFSRPDVGVTAAIGLQQKGGPDRTVVAFDILLDDLFAAIARIQPSPNSRVLIFRRDAQLYVPGVDQGAADFQSVQEIKNLLVRKMVASWKDETRETGAAFSLVHDKETWWCGFRPVDASRQSVWIGVLVPEKDIVGGVQRRQVGAWGAGAAILLVGAGLTFWMVRRYGQTMDGDSVRFDSRNPQESVRKLIATGEGRSVEFKSTMRMNLHTGKAGKEIEMAWLKGVAAFMNTDGGTLLLGVADDGTLAGLEADGFANEDKCHLHFKNLINQHLGAEISRYLRFYLIPMDGVLIGVADCARAAEPVYLKSGKAETFYIRSGPSSDALPVSKVVAYLKNRK